MVTLSQPTLSAVTLSISKNNVRVLSKTCVCYDLEVTTTINQKLSRTGVVGVLKSVKQVHSCVPPTTAGFMKSGHHTNLNYLFIVLS